MRLRRFESVRGIFLPVALVLLAGQALAQVPTITSVVNGLSFASSLSPGVDAAIFGTNLTGTTSVTVGGTAAYITFVGPTQVNVQFPYTIPTGNSNVVVTNGSGSSAPFSVTISNTSPGIAIFVGYNSAADAAIARPVSPTNPAYPGQTFILSATGLGPTNPPSSPGTAPSGTVLASLPTVTVNGQVAQVISAGLSTGQIGFDQVTFVIPASTTQGLASVVLSSGGNSSLAVNLPVGNHPFRIETIAGQIEPNNVAPTSTFLQSPQGLAFDPSGNLNFVEVNADVVRRVTGGLVSAVAGTGVRNPAGAIFCSYCYPNTPATSGNFTTASYVAFDSNGNMFVSDQGNCTVDRVDAVSRYLTVYAGTPGSCGYTGDNGQAASAQLSGNVRGIAFDSSNNLYIADNNNKVVRRVAASSGVITTFAGNGQAGSSGDNGPATSAAIGTPVSLAFDKSGNLYIGGGTARIRRVDTSGNITTYAGTGTTGNPAAYTDAQAAASVNLGNIRGMAFDTSNNLYFVDNVLGRVLRIDATTKTVTSVGGTGISVYSGADGSLATSAGFASEEGIAVDAGGNLYVSDLSANAIRKITNPGSTGTISLFAGSLGTDGAAPKSAFLNLPSAVAVDSSNDILIADSNFDRIRKVNAGLTTIQTIAGTGYPGFGGNGGSATSALLNNASGVAVDSTGTYIADYANCAVRKVDLSGNISTIAGNGTCLNGTPIGGGTATSVSIGNPSSVAASAAGLYISSNTANVVYFLSSGNLSVVVGTGTAGTSPDGTVAFSALLNRPFQVAIDGTGNLFIADAGNNLVREVKAADGKIYTVAGKNGGTAGISGDLGAATSAQLNFPRGVAIAGNGDIYIADSNNSLIRMVTAATGLIDTIAGIPFFGGAFTPTGAGYTVDGTASPASAALLNNPSGMALDSSGRLIFSDGLNNIIRRLTPQYYLTTSANPPNGGTVTGAGVYDAGANVSVSATANSGFTFGGFTGSATGSSSPVQVTMNGPQGVVASFTACSFGFTPTSASPAAVGTTGSSVSFTVSSPSNCAWTAVSNSSWITLTGSTSGTGSASVTYNVAANAGGSRTGAILFGSASFQITQAAAAPAITGIANAADGSAAPLAPGSLASIFGTNLAGSTQQSSAPFSTSFANVSVSINGSLAAPVLFVSPGQINFQIPYETPTGTTTVVLTNNGTASNSFQFTVAATAPAITTNPVIQNANFSANSSGNPAGIGTTVIVYLTGVGAVSPAVADGAAAPTSPLALPTAAYSATIGGTPATVLFLGLLPGNVGLAQANISVPMSLTAGSYPVVITVGGVASKSATVYVTVAPPAMSLGSSANPIPIGPFTTGNLQFALGASGGNGTYSWSVTAGSLPTGLTLRSDLPLPSSFTSSQQAGLIGVATTPGTYNFTLQVTSNGQSTSQAVSMKITSLTVADPFNLLDGFATKPYSYTFTVLDKGAQVAAGNPGITFTLTNTPSCGLTLSSAGVLSSSGTSSGNPSAGNNCSIAFTVYDGTDTISRTFNVNVYAISIATSGTTPGVMPNATQGSSYSQTLTATGCIGTCTFNIVSGNLPNGLSGGESGNTATIATSSGGGTVTASPGNYNFSVQATDGTNSYTLSVSLDVVGTPPALVRLNPGGVGGGIVVGNPNSSSLGVCCGGTAPFTWNVDSQLPPGLRIRYGSGITSSNIPPGNVEIVGIPLTAGDYTPLFTVTDANGGTASLVVPLHVSVISLNPTPALPNGTISTAYSATMRLIGGTPPYSAALIGGTLPDGLGLSGLTVSGNPLENGSFAPLFVFTDSASPTANTVRGNAGFNIAGAASGSAITINNNFNLGLLVAGSSTGVNNPSFFNLNACCVSPVTWSVVNGATTFPSGLSLNVNTGAITGTASPAGVYTFLVKATDASGSGAAPGYKQFTLNITPISINTNNTLPFGNAGSVYSPVTLNATGGTGNLTWTLTANNYLPPGISLNSSTGVLSSNGSTLPSPGQYFFDIMVTDSANPAHTADRGFTLIVYPAGGGLPLAMSFGSNLGTFATGDLQYPLGATGGNGTYSWSITAGSAPTGLTLRADVPSNFTSSQQAGLIGVATTPGTYNFTLQLGSGAQTPITQAVSMKITSLTVADPFNLPDAFATGAYSYTFTVLDGGAQVAAGNKGMTFTLTNTPTCGLSLSPIGVLSGTPTVPNIGSNCSIQFTVSDGTDTISRNVNVNVYAISIATPGATPGVMPNATQGGSYSQTLTATGCSGSCTFSLNGAGFLPNGFSLTNNGNSTATIATNNGGTVTAGPGNSNFSVQASDGTHSYTLSVSLDVIGVPPALVRINAGNIDDPTVGVPFSTSIGVCCGGTAPFAWSVDNNLPAGLRIRTGSGATSSNVSPGSVEIVGVPLTSGTFTPEFTVTDANGATASLVIPIHVSVLDINPSNPTLLNGTINSPYPTTTMRVIGGAAPYGASLVGGTLPDGLSLSNSGLTVSGTPLENGNFSPQFVFTDPVTVVNTLKRTINFNIFGAASGSAISINNNSNLGSLTAGATTGVNNPSFFNLNACCVSPVTWSVVSGSTTFPSGLSLNVNTGAITGTAGPAGVYTFLVKATDASGSGAAPGYKQFTLNITPLAITTSNPLPSGNEGSAYPQVSFTVTGSTGQLTWLVGANNYLPPSMSLSTTGVLSSNNLLSTGHYSFDITVADSGTGATTDRIYSVDILLPGQAPAVAITTGAGLGTWNLGTDEIPLAANGGTGTFAWSLTAGTLPPGLLLRSDVPTYFSSKQQAGLIGVSTTPGTYNFTLQVSSGTGISPSTASQAFSLTISSLAVTDFSLPDAFEGKSYSYNLTAIGNKAGSTVTFSPSTTNTNNPLPAWLNLSSTGQLSGTPTQAGDVFVTITLTDGTSLINVQFDLFVEPLAIALPAGALSNGALPNATQFSTQAYSAQLTASGGTTPYTYAISGGNLPSGFSLNTTTGVISTVAGVPLNATPGLYAFGVTATDSGSPKLSYARQMSIDVVGSPIALQRITGAAPINDLTVGNHYSVSLSVCCGGTAPFTWASPTLPAGLFIRTGWGVTQRGIAPGQAEIYGVPLAVGTSTVQVTVTDATGASTSSTFTMNVSPLDISLLTDSGSSFSLPSGTISVPYTATLRVLGGSGSYSFQRTQDGELPSNLAITSNTLTVSGTPQENISANPYFLFTDSNEKTLLRNLNIQIGGGTNTISVNSNGTDSYILGPIPVNVAYSNQLSACCIPGNSYTWTVFSGSLPSGNPAITLSSSGVLSGTPTQAGTFNFVAKAADPGNLSNAGYRNFTLIVSPVSITTTSQLPNGNVGSSYLTAAGGAVQLVATGQTGAVVWSFPYATVLPPGLSFNPSTGILSGTPTSAGSYQFTVQATDQGTGNNYVLKTFALNIYPAGVVPPVGLNFGPILSPVPVGHVTFLLNAFGGATPAAGSVSYHYAYTPNATPIPGMRVQDTGLPMPTNFYNNGSFSATTSGGLIGVITAPGTYSSSIRATDSLGNFYDRAFTLTVSALNILDQTSLPKATLNSAVPYSYQLTPTGSTNLPYVFKSPTGLPLGITLSSGGLFSGTPTQAGTFNVSFSLADASGTGTISLNETIIVDPFAITNTGVLPTPTVNQAYSQTFTAPNCGTSCAWSVSSGSLPTGLNLNGATGVISGTFTNTTGSVTSFTVQAKGSAGTVQKIFALIIPPTVNVGPPSITTSFTLTPTVGGASAAPLTATGGTPPYTFQILSSNLTAATSGISLQGTGDTISSTLAPGFYYLAGRPLQAGPLNFNIQVTDAKGVTATKALTWNISPISLEYSNLPLAGTLLILQAGYSQQLLASGGSGTYSSWTLPAPVPGYPAGTVFPGLTLNSGSGLISGTPTNTGSVTQPVQVTDSNGASATQNLTVGSAPNLTLSGPNSGTVVTLGSTNTYNITPNGGTGPYNVTLVGNKPACAIGNILNGSSLTPGFTSAASAPGTWELQLTFQQAGTCVLTLQATDSSTPQLTGARTYTFVVADVSNPLPAALPNGSVGTAYSQHLYAFGGTNAQWALASGALPPGNPAFAISAAGLLTGTPTQAGTYVFNATFSDASGSVTAGYTLTISNLAVTNGGVLPLAYNNVSYNFTLNATGGTSPYIWTDPSGTFNNLGLTLNGKTGAITGTPTGGTGVYTFTVSVTDSATPANSIIVPVTLYLEQQNTGLLTFNLANTALGDAVLDQVYSVQIRPDGGVPQYTVALTNGSTLPPGLSLLAGASNVSPGVTELAGQPSAVGQYTFSLTITDSKGSQITRAFTLNVTPLNLTVGNNTINITAGSSYTQQFTGSGGSGSYTFAISGGTVFTLVNPTVPLLPQGMFFGAPNCSAGALCGTPAVPGSDGSYSFRLTVTDANNSAFSYTKSYTLNVTNNNGLYISSTPSGPTFIGASSNNNNSFAASTTSGSPSTYTWSFASGTLPTGLTLQSNGTLTGTVAAAGTFTYVVQATDTANSGNIATRQVTQIVSPMQQVFPAQNTFYTAVIPGATVGQAYLPATSGYTFGVAGGTPPYHFTESTLNPLPLGMSLSTSGVLSGTPTQLGDFLLRPIVTDSSSPAQTFINSNVTLSVAPAGVAIPLESKGPSVNGNATYTLNDATYGSAYAAKLDRFVFGGAPPYQWSVANGSSLPAGISIIAGSNGVGNYLGGAPTTQGQYTFTLTAADSGTQTLAVSFSLNVSVLTLSPGAPAVGQAGSQYTLTFTPSGGTAPYSIQYASESPTVPGLTLSGNSLTGTITSPGIYPFGVTLTDSAKVPNTLFRIYEIYVDDKLGEVPTLSIAPQPVTALYTAGSGNLPQQNINVNSSSGAVQFGFAVLGVPVSSVGGGTVTPATDSVVFNPSNTVGTYFGIAAAASTQSSGLGSQAVNSGDATLIVLTVIAPPPCSYSINPGSLSVGASGTPSSSFSVTAGTGCQWTAAPDSNSSWISITNTPPASGNGTVQFSVAQNTAQSQRSGNLLVSAGGNTQQTFTVTQFGLSCSFSISPTALNVPASFNGGPISATITVNASSQACPWLASSGLSVVTPTSPTGNGQATITIPVNGTANTVNPTAVIAGQTLTVNQAGTACNIALSASGASYDANGAQGSAQGSVTLTGAQGCTYATVPGPGWIQVTSNPAGTIGVSGAATLTYSVDPNSTTVTRSGTLLIAGQPFQITEQGLACSISLDTTGLPNPFDTAGATKGIIAVTTNGSNCPWTASSGAAFAAVSPQGGSGSGQITVSLTSNASSTSSRTTSLAISGQNIGITQAGTTCTFQLRSSNGSMPASGGVGTVDVVAPSACSWTATSNAPSQVTVNSGASSSGTAEVQYIVASNASTTTALSPTLTVAGITFTINQPAAICSYTPGANATLGSSGGANQTFTVSAPGGCAAPTVSSYANWLTLASPSVTGSGPWTVTYTALANPSGSTRNGNIQVGDKVFVVSESGAACAYSLNAYGATFGLLGGAGNILASANAGGCTPAAGPPPSFVALGSLAGPANNIFTQPFTVSPFSSAVKATRKGQFTFGGLTFTFKQYSY